MNQQVAVLQTRDKSSTAEEHPEKARPAPRRWIRKRRLGWVVVFGVCLWLSNLSLSFAIRHSDLRNRFTAHLEVAFGRQVEVGSYALSLWTGPVLEARSVRVSEDPRFGQEYFLRAESISVRLRWRALLHGHLELGTLSLSQPSLNIVRNAAGDWNLEEWLSRTDRPAFSSGGRGNQHNQQSGPASGGLPSRAALRFHRIEVSDGRINFKHGDEKLAFAFADLSGSVETDGLGRWHLSLDARPVRAALVLQKPGTIHLAGYVGGTSSRLRPGDLSLSWNDASLTDLLRLATGEDRGLRGAMNLSIQARTDGDQWVLQGRAGLRQLHRWDIPLRPDDPTLNVTVTTRWHPATSDLDALDTALELPHSSARITGVVDWSPPLRSSSSGNSTKLHVTSSRIDLRDVLPWVRAFHPGLPQDVVLHGSAAARLDLIKWPPSLQTGAISVTGATLTGKPMATPLRLTAFTLDYGRSGFRFSPATVSLGESGGSLRVTPLGNMAYGPLGRNRGTVSGLRMVGDIPQTRNLIAIANALGWNLSKGWDISGPMRCDLRWIDGSLPWRELPVGDIVIGSAPGSTGASLWAPFLNLPIDHIRAAVSLKQGDRQVDLAAASAFGARWSGTVMRRDSGKEWQFSLRADRLSEREIDRWLDPRWRQSFLDRVLPFLNSGPAAPALPEALRARGTLNVDAFVLSTLELRNLVGDLNIEGRNIRLRNANARLYGGRLGASFEADLQRVPSYKATIDFSRIDISALAERVPGISGSVSGSASGRASFAAMGTDRGVLLSSLACNGAARLNDAGWSKLDVPEASAFASVPNETEAPGQAQASFRCDRRGIRLRDIILGGTRMRFRGSGTVGYDGAVDLRVRPGVAGSDPSVEIASDSAGGGYQITGSLATPRIARIETPAGRASPQH